MKGSEMHEHHHDHKMPAPPPFPAATTAATVPNGAQAQNEKQPAISPTEASTYTIAVFIDARGEQR